MTKEQDKNLRQGNRTQQANAAARLAEAERINRGVDPEHPVPGSQAWAEKNNLAEKKENPK
jgi:hypothetical protein